MKYIRTKDGIYEYTSNSDAFDGVYTTTMGVNHLILYKEIIKQADTIEELCDEFVIVNKDNILWCVSPNLEFAISQLKNGNELNLTDNKLFGAILTEKGIIYVAKMNEKGELELL